MITEHQQKIQLLLNLLQGVKKKKYRKKGPWLVKNNDKKVKLKCNNCGKIYYIFPSQHKQRLTKNNPSTLCCSVKCKGEFESIERKKMSTWVLTTCENIFCKKRFYSKRGYPRKFCSKKCYAYSMTTEYAQKKNIMTKANDNYAKKTNANLFKR